MKILAFLISLKDCVGGEIKLVWCPKTFKTKRIPFADENAGGKPAFPNSERACVCFPIWEGLCRCFPILSKIVWVFLICSCISLLQRTWLLCITWHRLFIFATFKSNKRLSFICQEPEWIILWIWSQLIIYFVLSQFLLDFNQTEQCVFEHGTALLPPTAMLTKQMPAIKLQALNI